MLGGNGGKTQAETGKTDFAGLDNGILIFDLRIMARFDGGVPPKLKTSRPCGMFSFLLGAKRLAGRRMSASPRVPAMRAKVCVRDGEEGHS